VYYLPKILEQLQLTEQEFIYLCICSGNDYCSNIYNYCCNKNYKLIKQYEKIENFPEEMKPKGFERVREIFSGRF